MKKRKIKFQLPPLERKVFQEAYRLTGLKIPRLRVALSPVIKKFEPPPGKVAMNKNPKKKYPIWSDHWEESISLKAYHDILSPPEVSIEDREIKWSLSEPGYLKKKERYIVAHQKIRWSEEDRQNYFIFSRSSPNEEVTFHYLINKTGEEANSFIENLKAEFEKNCRKISDSVFIAEIKDIRGFTGRKVPAPHFKISQNCIAVHAVKIQYAKNIGKRNTYILVIIDRPTGYVKIRYYPNLSIKHLLTAIVKFRLKLYNNFKILRNEIHFVSEPNGQKATALSLSKQELADYFKTKGIDAENVIIEPPIVFAKEESLQAQWLKKSSKLQERLVFFQNWYNLGRQKWLEYSEDDSHMQENDNKCENDNRPILLIEKEYVNKKDEIDYKYLKYSEIKRILRSH